VYATTVDKLESASQSLRQRVEAMAAEGNRAVDKLTEAHGEFTYPLAASLIERETSGVATGEAGTLGDAAIAFEKYIEDAEQELDVLWADWGRSWGEVASTARALAAGGLDVAQDGGRIPQRFERSAKHELESFRRTCEGDLERMEELEQVRECPAGDAVTLLGWFARADETGVGIQGTASEPHL
jgi:hypothetical protein